MCEVEGCNKPRYQNRTMCGSHYMKWYRHGDPLWMPNQRGTCTITDCNKPHSAQGWCKEHYDRYLRYGDPLAAWVPRTDITYAGAHDRVEASRGKPSEYECEHCGSTAAEWAYDHNDPTERTTIMIVKNRWSYVVPYSVDPDYYIPLCIKCHRHLDRTYKQDVLV